MTGGISASTTGTTTTSNLVISSADWGDAGTYFYEVNRESKEETYSIVSPVRLF